MIEQILKDLVASVNGAQAVIFLDGDGESIAEAGVAKGDIKMVGAWKEIELDRVRSISRRLGHGDIHAILFSLEEGSQLMLPVTGDYCVLVLLSAYADVRLAMGQVKRFMESLRKEIG